VAEAESVADRRTGQMSSGWDSGSTCGCVYLVGAGPGDPGLLTVRGQECLRKADVVFYDGLVNPLILRHTSGRCERTSRSRTTDGVIVSQAEINRRMIEEASAGKCVVRLKGGDPCIFGRGGEEAAALQEAGIPCEIVPGITAATAAASYAGFALTHREISSAVAFITGHETPDRDRSLLDDCALAAFPGTLVFYMGLARLTEVCERLIAGGKSADTPATMISRATLPAQRTVIGTLSTIHDRVRAADLRAPSLLIVGECAAHQEPNRWFENLPLFGLSIAVTRPQNQTEETVQEIVRQGGEPVLLPLIEISPVDDAQAERIRQTITQLSDFRWLIFTSANGVDEFFRHLSESGKDLRAVGHMKIAAVGNATAASLRELRLIPDLIAAEARAESLACDLSAVADGRCLWLRADRARETLAEVLSARGVQLSSLIVYRSGDCESFTKDQIARLKAGTVDWIGLSSPASARRFRSLLDQYGIDVGQFRVAAISLLTSETAQECGLTVAAVAEEASWHGILKSVSRARDSE
jgi:uroporphyrinogen III methyltransferase/synthase